MQVALATFDAAIQSYSPNSVSLCTLTCTQDAPPPLYALPLPPAGPERVQVALATFDSAIQFYSFRSGGSQPGMLIVTDITEPFVPDSVPLVRCLVVWEVHGQGVRSLAYRL